MKNKIIYGIALIAFSIGGFAQVKALKIGDNPGSIDPSAALEIASTTKGLLPPRMNTAEMNAINNPIDGLIVYCNDLVKGFYIRSNGAWVNLSTSTDTDATTTVKGRIQLAGDLAGTAEAPLVANSAITTDKIAPKAVIASKLDAGAGAANRILTANATGDAKWNLAPFAETIQVAGGLGTNIRGNNNYTDDTSFEFPYFTSSATLTKGLYMYVNAREVYHGPKSTSAAFAGDVEAVMVWIHMIVDAGTATAYGSASIPDAGVYKYASAGQTFFFEVTSDTATVKFRYRPRTTDDTQSTFQLSPSQAFTGRIFKIF